LRELGALSDEQATPEIRRCIGRIERLTRHADAVFCDNRALNALLQYYAGFADEGGIPIHVAVACGALDVDEADLVLAVGNVLDNALTAAGEYYEGGLQTRCALETVNADGTELNETADITWTKDADGKPLSYTVVLKNDGAYAATTTGDVKTDESGLISWVGNVKADGEALATEATFDRVKISDPLPNAYEGWKNFVLSDVLLQRA
jgi:hypothetical protein